MSWWTLLATVTNNDSYFFTFKGLSYLVVRHYHCSYNLSIVIRVFEKLDYNWWKLQEWVEVFMQMMLIYFSYTDLLYPDRKRENSFKIVFLKILDIFFFINFVLQLSTCRNFHLMKSTLDKSNFHWQIYSLFTNWNYSFGLLIISC